jgi:glycosyltransferase involved in cell wall biosynthesis
VLPVGVDTKQFAPTIFPNADVMAWKGGSVLLAYAGNTKWYQGVEGVLEAFAKLHDEMPGVYKFLVIASSGVEEVQAYAHEHNLESEMMIHDKQPHDAIPGLLSAADVLTVVRPSDMVTEFSFPSKLPEYAALGKALIVSRVSDIETYIQHEVNGMVVNPSDAEGLYNALKKLRSRELREKLGGNVRQLAEKTFDLTILGDKLFAFLQTLK